MIESVVDASTVIAVVLEEPITDDFRATLTDSVWRISTVNLAEVIAKFADRGMNQSDIAVGLARFSLALEPFTIEDAWQAGILRPLTRSLGLSLGDRACLALAIRLGIPAVTMDRAWATLDLPVKVVVARP